MKYSINRDANKPLVSVIVNCYNSASYLDKTIESILNQTYRNFEIVFWDNQSTDNSAEIYLSYKDLRCKYFYADEHTKLSTARNLAIEKASGEFIAFIDCDDLWMSSKLEYQVDVLLADPEVGFVYSDFDIIMMSNDDNAKSLYYSYSRFVYRTSEKRNIYHKLLEGNFIIFSSVIVRKSIFVSTGGFKPEFSHDEDYDLLIKCSLISKGAVVNKKLISYRIHSSNNSFNNRKMSLNENSIILASLPNSSNVRRAIIRNKVRIVLFKFKTDKNVGRLFLEFLNFKMALGLCDVTRIKVVKLLFDNKISR